MRLHTFSPAVQGRPAPLACRPQPTPRRRAAAIPVRAAKDAGRLLRDAMQQPKAGGNLAALAAGNYLRSLGIDAAADVARILDVLTNPNSLFGTKGGRQRVNPYARRITVDEMTAVVDCLKARGLTQEAVVGVILEFPQALSYPVERLESFFAYLTSPAVGLEAAAVAELVTRRPNVVGLEPANLERIVGWLVDMNGASKEEVIKMLETSL